MLQGIESEIGQPGGIKVAVDPEDTAFIAKFIEKYVRQFFRPAKLIRQIRSELTSHSKSFQPRLSAMQPKYPKRFDLEYDDCEICRFGNIFAITQRLH